MKKISCVVMHGIETIRTQYEQMGETMDELKELAEELERFVDSEDEEVHTLDLTRFEPQYMVACNTFGISLADDKRTDNDIALYLS